MFLEIIFIIFSTFNEQNNTSMSCVNYYFEIHSEKETGISLKTIVPPSMHQVLKSLWGLFCFAMMISLPCNAM